MPAPMWREHCGLRGGSRGKGGSLRRHGRGHRRAMGSKHSRKRKRPASTAAALAAAPALQRGSPQIEDFTQQLMDAMAHASATTVGVLQPSTSSSSSSSEEEDGTRYTRGHATAPVAAPAVKDTTASSATATPPAQRSRSRTTSRPSAECSPCNRVARTTPARRASPEGHNIQLRACSIQAACTPPRDEGRPWPGDASRTEAELLQQHGHLSQFNSLYSMPKGSGTHSGSSSSTSGGSEGAVDGGVADGGGSEAGEAEEERRVRRRRRELSEIPPGSLALYTRLAECGVDAVDRPFATCVVRRAQGVVEAWAAGFV
ncbi:uncharacterized protein Tco025E_02884 [Trypanosoma conorhini]|uniref:Uncharacterized protein n=1 Tax=Trypanosoma conorhini TaxID=83891 RepID=A0A3R7NJZ6_9TRYP|nr:uncharacterized protein Tco025E_02884 [Trypanosoma conorhini]RNF23136.1 hypothetical protein Tco025E_02884 [Trypanosoma conorhini]